MSEVKLTETGDFQRDSISLEQAVHVVAHTTMAGLSALAGDDPSARNAALGLLLYDIGIQCKDRAMFTKLARAVADTFDLALEKEGGE